MDGGKWRRLTQPGLAIDRRIKLLKNLSGYVLPPGDRRATGFQFVIARAAARARRYSPASPASDFSWSRKDKRPNASV